MIRTRQIRSLSGQLTDRKPSLRSSPPPSPRPTHHPRSILYPNTMMTVTQQPNNDASAQDPKDVHLPEDKAPSATSGGPLRSDDIQLSHAFRAAECHSRWLETQKAAEDEARKTSRAAPKDVARSIMRIQRACRTPAPDQAVENILDAFERVKPLLPLIFQKTVVCKI